MLKHKTLSLLISQNLSLYTNFLFTCYYLITKFILIQVLNMKTNIQIQSFNIPRPITIREKTSEQKNNSSTSNAVNFKGANIKINKNDKVIKSGCNSFLTEVATALRELATTCGIIIELFKLKDKTLDFEKMSRKEIKTYLAQRQFRLSFDSSYEKYNISGKSVNLVTNCKKYPEFAKEIFNMKQKDIFHRPRFKEEDIAELFLSYEVNPKLTKELIEATNSDGSGAFRASTIKTLVELKDDELVRDCLKNWSC